MIEILFPLNFKRQYAAPLDVDMVFDTVANKTAYLSNARRYAGQIVTCLEEEGKVFILSNDTLYWVEISGSDEFITTSEVASISGDLQQQIDAIVIQDVSEFITTSEVASISGDLQQQIDALSSSGVTSIEGLTGIVDISGGWGINISTAGNSIVIKNTIEYVSAPVSPSSPGEKGQRAYSSNYVYECIDTNTWVRYASATTW